MNDPVRLSSLAYSNLTSLFRNVENEVANIPTTVQNQKK